MLEAYAVNANIIGEAERSERDDHTDVVVEWSRCEATRANILKFKTAISFYAAFPVHITVVMQFLTTLPLFREKK